MRQIFLLLFCITITGCANIVAPTGGEGNKTAPEVINCSAINGTINFIPKNINIEFNSYMNRSSVIENLQISPTTKYTYKWKAKKLIITFTEELKSNVTYSVSISGKYSDHYGNTAETPFYTCFSTGNIIDSCKITGKLYTSNSTGYYVFCYIHQDSIDFFKSFPDYKILVGGNGIFVVPALKDGKYIVLAVKDINKNGIITQSDTIAIPQFISEINNCSTQFVELIPNYVHLFEASSINIDTNINIDTSDIIKDDTIKVVDTSINIDTSDIIKDDTIKVVDTNVYLHLSGKVVIDTDINIEANANKYLIISQAENKIKMQTKINDDNTFLFENLLAGEYEIFYFIDINGNEKFDKGSLIPFEVSEPFKIVGKEVKLNNRWSIEDYTIEIK